LGCAPRATFRDAVSEIEADRPENAVDTLLRLRERNPNNAPVAMELGKAYFKLARRALDDGDQRVYLDYLTRAQNLFLDAASIQPRAPQPHIYMAIVAAFQSDLDRVLTDLKNARRLSPRSGVSYSNLAEVYIYLGNTEEAARNMELARRYGIQPVVLEMLDVLAEWRAGDVEVARDSFATAYALNPRWVQVWNEAPVSEPIRSFDDFARFCCSHLSCGPYLEDACKAEGHSVPDRGVDPETVRRELVLEMERRRRLREIYKDRGDLEIEVEPDAE
jgi:tetratricopeptide (TPR) repeat protein